MAWLKWAGLGCECDADLMPLRYDTPDGYAMFELGRDSTEERCDGWLDKVGYCERPELPKGEGARHGLVVGESTIPADGWGCGCAGRVRSLDCCSLPLRADAFVAIGLPEPFAPFINRPTSVASALVFLFFVFRPSSRSSLLSSCLVALTSSTVGGLKSSGMTGGIKSTHSKTMAVAGGKLYSRI